MKGKPKIDDKVVHLTCKSPTGFEVIDYIMPRKEMRHNISRESFANFKRDKNADHTKINTLK